MKDVTGEMFLGMAIEAGGHGGQNVRCGCFGSCDHTVSYDNMILEECWKCPQCGHSEEMRPATQLRVKDMKIRTIK